VLEPVRLIEGDLAALVLESEGNLDQMLEPLAHARLLSGLHQEQDEAATAGAEKLACAGHRFPEFNSARSNSGFVGSRDGRTLPKEGLVWSAIRRMSADVGFGPQVKETIALIEVALSR